MVVVLGGFFVQITTFDTNTSWCNARLDFEQNLFSNSAKVVLDLSFVGTISNICINLMSRIAQILVSIFGIRIVLCTGTFLVTLGLEMAGFSTQIWHLYLTHGIAFGTGASLIYMSVTSVAPRWFTKRRGLDLGLIASGSGIGGLIIYFLMKKQPVAANLVSSTVV